MLFVSFVGYYPVVHGFVRNLITEWRRHELATSGTIVIGVSGGADSVSLLLAMQELFELKKLDLRIIAAHYNHHLRGDESDDDEAFVKQLASERRIELAVGNAGPDDISNGNIEQKARLARYAFLSETAKRVNAFAVLTGHTMNDQAETFLINLLRGSGPTGLCGMKPVRLLDEENRTRGEEVVRSECGIADEGDREANVDMTDDETPLLPFSISPLLLARPLLTWAKRLHTEGYCHDKGVEYRYDTMNEDTAFKRVRVRKILLPLLADFNPNIVDTLARTASLMQGTRRDKLATSDQDTLEIAALRAMSASALYDTLRAWLTAKRGHGRAIGMKHIQAIERLIKSEKSGRVAELPGKTAVVRSNGRLEFRENMVD